MAYISVDLGRNGIKFRNLGSKAKYFRGAADFFQGFGDINALF